jgi:UDP-N-acetylglucosamine--N-acetylmuramyl-(pentapeptide) pyrophosphoryl-undecaprenol N-acetylglucosamine transferase
MTSSSRLPSPASRLILVMAGGTGGHVFPALAVADRLAAQGWRVVWLGTRQGMESTIVPKRGYPMEWVKFSGVRGKGIVTLALLPFFIVLAFIQSARAILRLKPNVVLGMGGFAAFPGGMMASLLNRRLVIHEQNSIAGLTNRMLAVVADRVLTGFPNPFGSPKDEQSKDDGKRKSLGGLLSSFIPYPSSLIFVGNPVRPEIAALAPPPERFAGRTGSLRLLIVGGSLGAQALNTTLPQALALMQPTERPRVVHQAGAKHIDGLTHSYAAAQVAAELKPFIEDMAAAYGDCDLLVCRAGALTVAEICAAGVASVLVPFPFAVDDHQSVNARFLSDQGAAVLLPQTELTAQRLADLIKSFTRDTLLRMAEQARALAKPNATEDVARICLEAAA